MEQKINLMEIIYYTSSACLIAFMILATYDGLYLHLWKYELFKQEESKFEHKTHTIRAILFPIIVWLLFLNNDPMSFWIGMAFVAADLVVLGMDAYSEKDSRKFMGGLPRWEYIVHLFSNGFHFAAIALVVSIKIFNFSELAQDGVITSGFSQELFIIVAENTLPGAILLAALHLLLISSKGQKGWLSIRSRVKCC